MRRCDRKASRALRLLPPLDRRAHEPSQEVALADGEGRHRRILSRRRPQRQLDEFDSGSVPETLHSTPCCMGRPNTKYFRYRPEAMSSGPSPSRSSWYTLVVVIPAASAIAAMSTPYFD